MFFKNSSGNEKSSIVESEPQLFALAEPEPERIPVPNSLSVLEPDLDPTPR